MEIKAEELMRKEKEMKGRWMRVLVAAGREREVLAVSRGL